MERASEAERELLPCPFCGGEAQRIDIEDGENAFGACIECKACHASSNLEFGRKENFVSNWNRRAILASRPDDAALRDKIEGLEADLFLAVSTAYQRGAVEWARLNYPEWIERLGSPPATSEAWRAPDGFVSSEGELDDAAENLRIAIGMGWDLDGVLQQMQDAIAHHTAPVPPLPAKAESGWRPENEYDILRTHEEWTELLRGRDTFLAKRGLFTEFVDSLPQPPAKTGEGE